MNYTAEERYIFKRKIKAFGNKICFYLCRVFPIDKKLVSVCTFEGKGGFGCNPKYVVQELHKKRPDIKFVWFVNKDVFNQKKFPDYIKKVPNTLWSRAYWLSRSKVWIDNYRKPYGTVKRKGQYYLNTNHYTLSIKTLGLWRGSGFSKMAYLVSKNDSDMIDDVVIDSKFCEIMCPKGLIYHGTYLKTGAPRCDALYGDRTVKKKAFREKHNLPINAKVVMFAPTFREGSKDGKRSVFSEIWTIDFERLLKNLGNKFGGEWYVCVRVHPQLAPTFKEYRDDVLQGRIIDESQSDDMYEILAGMDAYITDYSSACFEAGFAEIPVFLYADDIKQYEKNRGALFWNMTEAAPAAVSCNRSLMDGLDVYLPFSVATNNDELERNIREHQDDKYLSELMSFSSKIQHIFDGNSSSKIADRVEQEINNG